MRSKKALIIFATAAIVVAAASVTTRSGPEVRGGQAGGAATSTWTFVGGVGPTDILFVVDSGEERGNATLVLQTTNHTETDDLYGWQVDLFDENGAIQPGSRGQFFLDNVSFTHVALNGFESRPGPTLSDADVGAIDFGGSREPSLRVNITPTTRFVLVAVEGGTMDIDVSFEESNAASASILPIARSEGLFRAMFSVTDAWTHETTVNTPLAGIMSAHASFDIVEEYNHLTFIPSTETARFQIEGPAGPLCEGRTATISSVPPGEYSARVESTKAYGVYHHLAIALIRDLPITASATESIHCSPPFLPGLGLVRQG